MKLLGVRTSPYARHTRVPLAESGLLWQFEQVTPDTIKLSPTLRVPFFIDGDLTLTDSAVIVRNAREQSGQVFLSSVSDNELFALATSTLDTAFIFTCLRLATPLHSRASPPALGPSGSTQGHTTSASKRELLRA